MRIGLVDSLWGWASGAARSVPSLFVLKPPRIRQRRSGTTADAKARHSLEAGYLRTIAQGGHGRGDTVLNSRPTRR